jgi:hypothetical protein
LTDMHSFLRLTCLIGLLTCMTAKAQNPTWADDVACIVYSHCTSCHNPKGAAPFSLIEYDTAVLFASAIKNAVEHREMPPWPVDNNYRKMAHDRSLSDGERNAIINWVNTGTQQGNMGIAPAAPVYTNSEVITNPDLKLRIPTFTVPTITEDLYRCFVLPTGISVQKFITGIEIIPGNKSIVHHAQVFYDTTGTSTAMDANDPGPGYTSPGGIGTNAAVLLGTWVPGSSPIFVPSGMGKRLPPTAKIVIQIHYPEYASGKTDSTRVNFLFTSSAVRNIFDAPVLNHNQSMVDGPLFIPKNTVKTFHQQFLVPMVGTILNIGPHGHLLCQSMKAYGVTLAGDTIPLVHIPKWDFHWQGTYDFPQPIKIPFGTTLYGEATYDNTSDNPENPNDPPKDVYVGENTTDEMMLFYFSYLPYVSGDEHIVIDTASHKAHYNNCVAAHTSIYSPDITAFTIYPNPAQTVLNIQAENGHGFECYIFNQMGQLVLTDKDKTAIDISGFTNGIYYIHFIQDGKTFSRMLVKE